MSEHKRAIVVGSAKSGMVVVGSQQAVGKSSIGLRAKMLILALVGLIIVAGAGYGVYKIVAHHTHTITPPAQQYATLDAAEQAAATLNQQGNYRQALNILQAAQGKATTKAQKVSLYDQLSQTAQNMSNFQLAIQYYQKKHITDSSTTSADGYTLGELYSQIGQKSQAIAQYRLYIAYVQAHPETQPAPYGPDDVITSVNSLITSLESQK